MKRAFQYLLVVTVLGFVLYSCASVGRLEGGAIDMDPPVMIKSTPAMGALNVKKRKFSIEFDEFIKLDKPSEKVVISPPQGAQPEVKASGKKVIVSLEDSLKPNTTYTINFSDAIEDNNEGNPLENFIFTFSTGNVLDTMAVSGTVLNAHNLEPIKGIVTGVHTDLADSAFTRLPLERVGLTDSRGKFTILGLKGGKYRTFALKDKDNNYMYSQPTEMVAFSDSVVSPFGKPDIRRDTLWIDSLTVDTIFDIHYTHYYPDDIILRAFTEKNRERRLAKYERQTPKMFSLYFTADADSLPKMRGLNFSADNAFVVDKVTGRNDTLNYWIKDSVNLRKDTLELELSYMKTDSLYRLVPQTDTLLLVSKTKFVDKKALEEEQKNKKKKKKGGKEEEKETPKTEYLDMDVYAPSSMDVYDYVTFSFKEPVVRFDSSCIHLQQKVDTLWKAVPFEFSHDSTDIKKFNVYADWIPGTTYKLEVDSAAVKGLYGLFSNKSGNEFTVKKLEEYGQIFFNIENQGPIAFVELLDDKDEVVRTVNVEKGRADFYYLNPGKYCARLINDTNGNGVWDTGNYEKNLQPEMVYYYPQMVELKANFDLTQSWNVTEKPLDRQKPDALKKQKPDEDKKKRLKERMERDRKRY